MATIYVTKETKDGLNPPMGKDSYLTDPVLAREVVRWLHQAFPSRMRHLNNVLDPGAGRGVWGHAVSAYNLPWVDPPFVYGVELRKCKAPSGYTEWFWRTDYLKWETNLYYDLIIGNPPFKLAEAFVRKSLEILSEDGLICFLLPVDFSHSEKRGRGLFQEWPPLYEIALMQRPTFRGPDGRSLGNANPNNYIVMVWNSGQTPELLDHVTQKCWLNWKGN